MKDHTKQVNGLINYKANILLYDMDSLVSYKQTLS